MSSSAHYSRRCAISTVRPSSREVASMYGDMLMENWATPSLIVYVVVTILLVGFTDTHIGFGRRLFVGILHSSLHTICAFSLFLLLNMTIMIALEDGILSPVDKNALFEGSRGTPLTSVYEWDAAVQPMLKFMLRVLICRRQWAWPCTSAARIQFGYTVMTGNMTGVLKPCAKPT